MEKKIINDEILYRIAWSKVYKYDKYHASTVLPELSGILALHIEENHKKETLLFYSCWRDGFRVSMKKIMDPQISVIPELAHQPNKSSIFYKYTVIDSDPRDIQDVIFWLATTYDSRYNNKNFNDSGRYRNIMVDELQMQNGDVVERIPKFH